MTPAATLILTFRKLRRFQQKKAAYLLDVLQGYLSGIENGARNVQWDKFKVQIISGYKLNDAETDTLNEAIKYSNHKIILSLKMSESKFRLAHNFFNRLESMNQRDMDMINLILSLAELDQDKLFINAPSRRALFTIAARRRNH
ncbi:hypothetical protein [Methylophilus sp.]|jgi:transcriptional regulator with XRE-family HTH domain|uniref:hypothetical protein n=1 Tax=Methylophilus sp. TaxID=29541 RepID=UPI0011D36EA3|nr:hypothetical protein [Methylophilus sp.]TXI45770.1 MAG: hypothetical protein E6Q52_05150 [Methylophilus sp.]